jgi:hypothetical protein
VYTPGKRCLCFIYIYIYIYIYIFLWGYPGEPRRFPLPRLPPASMARTRRAERQCAAMSKRPAPKNKTTRKPKTKKKRKGTSRVVSSRVVSSRVVSSRVVSSRVVSCQVVSCQVVSSRFEFSLSVSEPLHSFCDKRKVMVILRTQHSVVHLIVSPIQGGFPISVRRSNCHLW